MEQASTEQYKASSLFLISLGVVIVSLLLVVALLNQDRDLALLALLVLALAAGTKAWTRWSLHRVECGLTVSRSRCFPGEELEVKAYADNRKILPVWVTLRAPSGSLVPNALSADSGLLWHQEARFSWHLNPARRGVYPLAPLQVEGGDLFGFFRRQGGTEAASEVLVYPRLVPLRPFEVKKRDFFGIAGARSPVDDPVYILGTTDYRNGRPAKHIHWKASARHHRLQEKLFEPTQHEKVLLVIEAKGFEEEADEAAFEAALEVAASLSVRLDREGCTQGFVTNGMMKGPGAAVIAITRNGQQMSRILEALARLRMTAEQDVLDVLRQGLVLPWGVTALCFVHHADRTAGELCQYFRHRRTPVSLFVSQDPVASDVDRLGLSGSVFRIEDIRLQEAEAS